MLSAVRKQSSKCGFSILEIAAVLVIGAVLLGSYAALMNARLEANNNRETRHRLEMIDEALKKYLERENRYPSPTDFERKLDHANFGREEGCPNEVDGRGGGSRKVCIGALPVRDLHLPDSFVSDAWTGRFVYAVTKNLTAQLTFDIGEGAIDILDGATGDSVLEAPGIAHYMVLSHGSNQKGAYSLTGTGTSDPGRCAPDASEMENCDVDNATFSVSVYTESSTTSNSMDDLSVYWPTTLNGGNATPSYMIMAFDRPTCPRGWTPNIWTDNTDVFTGVTIQKSKHTINGRVILGTGDYVEPPVAGQDSFSEPYSLRETGGEYSVMLEDQYLPSHTHTVDPVYNLVKFKTGSGTINDVLDSTGGTPSATYTTYAANRPYEKAKNEMPVMAFRYCMKM